MTIIPRCKGFFLKVSQVKILAAAFIINTCLMTASADPPKWTNPQNWRLQLQQNMTAFQVQSILGDPADREISNIAMIWYYQDTPTRVNGKVTERPKQGTVKFSINKVWRVYAVSKFTEPDWDRVSEFEVEIEPEEEIFVPPIITPPKTEPEKPRYSPDIQQLQQDTARQRQEEKERRQELARQRQIKIQQEQQKLKEDREKERANRAANKPSSPPPEKRKGFVGKYFLILGVVMFITVFVITIIKHEHT